MAKKKPRVADGTHFGASRRRPQEHKGEPTEEAKKSHIIVKSIMQRDDKSGEDHISASEYATVLSEFAAACPIT